MLRLRRRPTRMQIEYLPYDTCPKVTQVGLRRYILKDLTLVSNLCQSCDVAQGCMTPLILTQT